MTQDVKKKKKLNLTTIVVIIVVAVFALMILNVAREMDFKALEIQKFAKDSDKIKRTDLSAPIYSADSGFYPEEFMLTLTGDAGNTIYYTLDGSDPACSPMTKKYKEPLRIYDNSVDRNVFSARTDIALGIVIPPKENVDKAMIVRAVQKDSKGNYGETVTKCYFVGKTKSVFSDFRIISLVTNPYNLFDKDTGIYVCGNAYMKWRRSKDFNPLLENWNTKNPTNYNNSGPEWERPAEVFIYENGEQVFAQKVGIRLAGNVSRSNAQKSIRLYAREEYGDSKLRYKFFDDLRDADGKKIKKFDKITLRNGGNDTNNSNLRDEIVQELVKDRAISTQAESLSLLYIDGEYWGTYHIKERLEDYYFQSHYNIPKETISIVKNSEFQGEEKTWRIYQNFYDWAYAADMTDPENYNKFWEKFDMQSFMDYFAVETYINNSDWLRKSVNNCMMWRTEVPIEGNPYADGKWRFALFDTEFSANLYGNYETSEEYNLLGNLYTVRKWSNLAPVFYNLMNNDEFRKAFHDNYVEIVETCFEPGHVSMVIDDYADRYGEAIAMGLNRYLNSGENTSKFDRELKDVRKFYENRPEYALQYLEDLCKQYEK